MTRTSTLRAEPTAAAGAAPLRVLMVSTSYPEGAGDWRGRFIASLAEALARRGDIALSLWAPPGELPEGVAGATSPEEARWLAELARRGGIAHLLRTRGVAAAGAAGGLLRRLRTAYRRLAGSSDVLHVNWLQNALPLLGARTPVLASALGSDLGLLRLPGMGMLLRRALARDGALVAPNAGWMEAPLRRALGERARVEAIPFGVDARWFQVARSPDATGSRRWLAVARLTRAKLGALADWGEGLFEEQRALHWIGPRQEEIGLPDWVNFEGPKGPAELAQAWFPGAWGIVTLSGHDEGRPQVLLEAMAAGLPVIASRIPAHEDIIRHRDTGWLVGSRGELEEALRALDAPEEAHRVGRAARTWARDRVGTWDDCAARYVTAYRRLALAVSAAGATR